MGHDKHLPEDFFDLTRAEQEYCHEVAYFEEYGRCCNPLRESIRQQVMGKITDADVKEMNLWLISEGAKAGLNKASAEALNKFVLNQAIAKSIVAATVKGSVDSVGRRGAIIVTGNTVKYSMAVGGHAAFNGVKMEGRGTTFFIIFFCFIFDIFRQEPDFLIQFRRNLKHHTILFSSKNVSPFKAATIFGPALGFAPAISDMVALMTFFFNT